MVNSVAKTKKFGFIMAYFYILYSAKIDKYYVGSCLDLSKRLIEHNTKEHISSFTRRSDDWIVYFSISDLSYSQSRQIEAHVKRMKSRKYIENIKLYPSIIEKLIDLYK